MLEPTTEAGDLLRISVPLIEPPELGHTGDLLTTVTGERSVDRLPGDLLDLLLGVPGQSMTRLSSGLLGLLHGLRMGFILSKREDRDSDISGSSRRPVFGVGALKTPSSGSGEAMSVFSLLSKAPILSCFVGGTLALWDGSFELDVSL